jgi:hypothetical protein
VEKTENKVEKAGKFFGRQKRPATHHVSPHISPQTHHKNTTFSTPLLPKHPLKTQQKQKNPGSRQGLIFF